MRSRDSGLTPRAIRYRPFGAQMGLSGSALSGANGASDTTIALAGPGGPFGPEPFAEPRLAEQPPVDGAGQLFEDPEIDQPRGRQPAPDEPGADRGIRRELPGQGLH